MTSGKQVRSGWFERLSSQSEETEANLTKKALSELPSEAQSLDETPTIDFQQLLLEYDEIVERVMMILSGKTEYDAGTVEAYMNRYQDMKQTIGLIQIKNNEELSILELRDKIDQSVNQYQSMVSDGSLQLLISAPSKSTPRHPKREKKTKSKKRRKKASSSTVVVTDDPELLIENLSSSKNTPRKEKIRPHSEVLEIYEIENTEPFECPICIEEISVGKGYKIPLCNHTYCQQCLSSYLQQLINQALVLEIHCPHPSCETILSHTDIKRLCDSKTFLKYDEFLVSAHIKADPNARWCPNPKGCGNAIINDRPNENKKMHCDQCKFEFCFECTEEWHTGTCEDLQKWKIENGKVDKEFIKFVKSANTKKCPKCKVQIQKANGCNHMTCGNCHFQFCWLCGGRYTSSHFRIYNPLGCPMMQWKGESSGKFSTGKRIGMKALVGTSYIVGGAIAIPLIIPAVIIGAPIYGGYKLIKRKNRPNTTFNNMSYFYANTEAPTY